MSERVIKIGMLGLGTVGTGVVKLLQQRRFRQKFFGIDYQLKTIAVANVNKPRKVDLSGIEMTSDAEAVIRDPEIDIIIETMGGYEPAYHLIAGALKNRKSVVTANKALIATHGRELLTVAKENGVNLLFEASVGGGIPIIKGLEEGLVANEIESISAILNGTCNYILTRMHLEELDFEQALKEAQEKGFAEADPTLDIGGGDTAHKLTILASIAAGGFVDFKDVYVEGITAITKLDIQFAKQFGYTIKLLATYRFMQEGVDLRVHPTLVPDNHQLSAVSYEMNAVFVKGDFVGDTMFYGPGAGERPTASAIVGNVVDLSRDLLLNTTEISGYSHQMIDPDCSIKPIPIREIKNRFYLRLSTMDAPGVLAKIAGVLGENGVSIASMVQLESQGNDTYVPIVLLTHEASEDAMDKALQKIHKFDFLKEQSLRLRLF